MASAPVFVQNLVDALQKNLGEAGLECEVTIEPVEGTRMFRFFVISDGFGAMQHSERQTVVWRIADRSLPDVDAMKVSMIMTLTRAEFGEGEGSE